MAEFIDIMFNSGNVPNGNSQQNTEIVSALNKVSENLTAFDSILTKFISATASYSQGNPGLKDKQGIAKEIQAATKAKLVDFQTSPEGISQKNQTIALAQASLKTKEMQAENRKSALTNQSNPQNINAQEFKAQTGYLRTLAQQSRIDMAAIYQKKGLEASELGDNKTAKEFYNLASDAMGKGVRDGLSKSGISSIINMGTTMMIAKTLTSGIGSYYGYNTQIGTNALSNPLTNGYNYGGPTAAILQASAGQQYSMLSTGLTVAGTVIGGILGGPAGAGIGAGIGGAAGSIIGASGNSSAAIQAQAIGAYVNQRMSNQALTGSNANVAGLVSSVLGTNDKNLNINSRDPSAVFDPKLPIATEIAKGAGVYSKNFDAMNSLTQYAIAAQIPMQELSKIGSSSALLGLNSTQVSNAMNLAGSAGVGLNDLNLRTLAFQQGGMSLDSAQLAAAKSFQNVSGFQDLQVGAMTGSGSDRAQKDIIAKAFGLDYEGLISGDPKAIEGFRKATYFDKNDPYGSKMRGAIGDIFNITQSNLPLKDQRKLDSFNAAKEANAYQSHYAKVNQQISVDAYNGNIDANQIAKQMGMLAEGLSGSTINLQNFTSALGDATAALAGIKVSKDAYKGNANYIPTSFGDIGKTSSNMASDGSIPEIIAGPNLGGKKKGSR